MEEKEYSTGTYAQLDGLFRELKVSGFSSDKIGTATNGGPLSREGKVHIFFYNLFCVVRLTAALITV